MSPAGDGKATEQAAGLLALVELAESSRLARQGRYAEADAALATARRSPAGLDLRARMAAQQGRLDEATDLWEAAAGQLGNPDAFATELAAVAGGRRRRAWRLRWAAVGVAAVSGAAAVVWLADGRGTSGGDGAATREALVAQAEQLDRIEERLEVDVPTGGPTEPGPGDGLDTLEAQLATVDGADVARVGETLSVQFTDPVFVTATTLSPAGSAVLDQVGARLAREPGSFLVVVTGHTDAVPLPAGSRWGDADGLAVGRARVAADRLVAAGLPADLVVVGPRQGRSPYPELAGDALADARNRAVTLVVRPTGGQA